MGIDLSKLSLRYGCFGAEPWSEAMRREVEAKFGIKAMDTYGLSEIIGPGVASECHQAQNGLHIWEDHFLCELIDPDTTQVLPPGEAGELVLTTLTKEALPMIRYRTRDITRLQRRALRVRTHPSPHDAGHRPQRRHADHPRRQRLSIAGRGAPGGIPGDRAALSDRAHPRRADGRDDDRGGARARPPRPTSRSSPRWPTTCATISRRWWA